VARACTLPEAEPGAGLIRGTSRADTLANGEVDHQAREFTEAMKEVAAFPGWRDTMPTIKVKCAKIAKEHGLDLGPEDFDVKMIGVGTGQTAIIDVSYEVVMKPIPGRAQSHVFTIHAEPDAKRFGSLTQ
jgi:hypothetical protein